jgi:hypothetical protein
VGIALFSLNDALKSWKADTQMISLTKADSTVGNHEFVFQVPDGCFCIVSLSMAYFSYVSEYLTLINSKKFSPAVLCKSFITPGTFLRDDKRIWVHMEGLVINA